MIHFRYVLARKSKLKTGAGGYTLVEVLVVLFIIVLLAGIALPTVKDMLANQQVAKATRNLTTFMNRVRGRAIAEGRRYGIRIERLGDDEYGRCQSVRVRELVGIPPYSGDASNARAKLVRGASEHVGTAEFDAKSGSLIALSAQPQIWVQRSVAPPIQPGDFLELPGGRLVAIKSLQYVEADPQADQPAHTLVSIDLRQGRPGSAAVFPLAKFPSAESKVRYKIHRRPVPSSTAPYSLPRGVVIDLNYSGMQGTGDHYEGQSIEDRRHFAPKNIAPPPVDKPEELPRAHTTPIDIIFGPDGHVESVITSDNPTLQPADGLIFLCVGDADGVCPRHLLSTKQNLISDEPGAVANVLNLESKWVVINPSTGRITAAPVSTTRQVIPSVKKFTELMTKTDPAKAKLLNDVISDSRSLIIKYSDTEDKE